MLAAPIGLSPFFKKQVDIAIYIIPRPGGNFHLLFVPVELSSDKSVFSSTSGAGPSDFKSKRFVIIMFVHLNPKSLSLFQY